MDGRVKKEDEITISQIKYVFNLMKQFSLESIELMRTPMKSTDKNELKPIASKPNLCLNVGICDQPKESQCKRAKRILRYVNESINHRIRHTKDLNVFLPRLSNSNWRVYVGDWKRTSKDCLGNNQFQGVLRSRRQTAYHRRCKVHCW